MLISLTYNNKNNNITYFKKRCEQQLTQDFLGRSHASTQNIFYYNFIPIIKTTTKLNYKQINIFIQKRNYPGNNNNAKIIFNTRNILTPKINYYNTQLQRYMPRSTTVLCRPLNNIKKATTVFERKNINIDPFLKNNSLDFLLSKLKIISEDSTDFNTQIFIRNKINNNEKILDDQLKQILIKLNEIENLNIIQKEIIYYLKTYFSNNHPTISNAILFLEIWHKFNGEFNALNFQKKEDNATKTTNTSNNPQNKVNESLRDKQLKTEEKILLINTTINKLFLDCKNEPHKIILSPLLQHWFDYLKNRGSDLPLQPEEIVINNELNLLWKTYAPKQEDVLTKLKDNLKLIKENSTLEDDIKQDPLQKCLTMGDFVFEIERITNILNFLENHPSLSADDIKFLIINSSAGIIDAEGTFKLTQEAYQSFFENKNVLGFFYTKEKPSMSYILNKIKEKNYFIIDEYTNKPGSLIDISYLGHKSMVVIDNSSGKNIKIRIGLLTSTNDEDTFLLDEYQQTNPNSDKQNKKQYFRILSNFIIVDETEPLLVDMETTLLLQSLNSKDQDIAEILATQYNNKKSIWSDNEYQLSYNADVNFLYKIALIFYKKKLQKLEEDLNSLKEALKKLSVTDAEIKLKALEEEKRQIMEDQKFQQYLSKIPVEFQMLYKALKLFEKKQQEDESRKKIKQQKQNIKDAMDVNAKKLAQEQQEKVKTAKDKREDYKKKKLENISNE